MVRKKKTLKDLTSREARLKKELQDVKKEKDVLVLQNKANIGALLIDKLGTDDYSEIKTIIDRINFGTDDHSENGEFNHTNN